MKPLNQTLSLPQSAGSNLVFKETALRVLRILTATLYPPAKHFPNLVYLTNGKLILSYGKNFISLANLIMILNLSKSTLACFRYGNFALSAFA